MAGFLNSRKLKHKIQENGFL